VSQMGWQVSSLGEVLHKTDTVDPRKSPDKLFQYVDVSSVSRTTFSIQETTLLEGANAPSRARRQIKAGDVLFATIRPTLQRIAIVPDKLDGEVCSTGYFVLRPVGQVNNRFLYYYLFTAEFMEEIEKRQKGASYPAVNDGDVRQQKISYPPLPEQKQIVAILDKAFAAIDQAVANAERNLTNARELFESYLNKVFTERGEGWVEKRLGEIADFKNGLNFTKSSQGEKVRVVGVRDFKNNYWVPTDCLDTVQIDGELNKAYELKENDILVVRSNGNKQLIGRVLLVGKVNDKSSHSGFTIRVRVHVQGVDARYLAHYMKSESIRDMLVSSGEGANISSLNQKALSVLPIAFPNSDEQVVIVNRIELLGVELKKLETIYQQKLTALTEFKQSILQKAFRGELTAGDSYG